METGKNLILITGATGQQGGAVAHELLAKGNKVRAMTRKPDGAPARALAEQGAEILTGDLNDAASVERALEGAWGAFAVQNTWEAGVEGEEQQGLRFAELARQQGIQHIVYSSVGSAHRKTGIPHFENKWRIEEKIRSLGFPSHVILRPVFFMDNLTSPNFLPAIQQGQLAVAIEPTTVLQMIAVRDIGKYGRWAFEKHAELNGRAIDIAGDQQTMPAAAEILGRAIGGKLQFVRLPIGEIRKFSDDYAAMLEWFDRVGYNVDIAGTSRESGIRPTTLAEWAATVPWAPAPASR
ncbi:MAG: NmrA family NAD(P)-binding protein [Candidatus Eisenbacteria bacterium]